MKSDNKMSATSETFHGKIILIPTELTSKVNDKGKTKTKKADDNMVCNAETSAYSVLGALLDKMTDVPHVPMDRETSTLLNRRATTDNKLYPSMASDASKYLIDDMSYSSCIESET